MLFTLAGLHRIATLVTDFQEQAPERLSPDALACVPGHWQPCWLRCAPQSLTRSFVGHPTGRPDA